MLRSGPPDKRVEPEGGYAAGARAGEQRQGHRDRRGGEERQVRHKRGSRGEPYEPALPLWAEAPDAEQVADDEPGWKRGQPPADQRRGAVLASDVRSREGLRGN